MKYVAFYPSRPYWAVSEIDLEAPDIRERFRSQMKEVVFSQSAHEHTMIVNRDGRISLNIGSIVQDGSDGGDANCKAWGKYLDHLNALFLFLDCAVTRVQKLGLFNLHELTNRDAFVVSENGESVATESIAASFQMARNYDWHPTQMPITHSPLFFGRSLVTSETLDEMANTYFKAATTPGAIKAYAGISRALAACKIANFETSLVFSWFIIEDIINMLWIDHINSKKKIFRGNINRINTKRRSSLCGSEYTASVRSNMLELAGLLDFKIFTDINKIRSHRNKIVHQQSDGSVGYADALLGICTALRMAEQRWAVAIQPNTGLSITVL